MESFFVDYRDPVFSVIMLVSIVVIVSFMSYWWGIFKTQKERNKIEKFIKKFETHTKRSDDYKETLSKFEFSTESLTLLAKSFSRSGDFEKAIDFYLIVLKKITKKTDKRYVLTQLGKTYFKAGFLHRSEEVLIESLRLYPRNEIALNFLTMIYEKLKKFDDALKVLDSLEELGGNSSKQRYYIKSLQIYSDLSISDSQKIQLLLQIRENFTLAERFIVEIWQKTYIDEKILDSFDWEQILDLLWYMSVDFSKLNNPLSSCIRLAKGISDEKECQIFEFEVLGKLKKTNYTKANLAFEYTCSSCKQVFPMHFYRCPNCQDLETVKIIPIITKEANEESMPF